MQTVTDILVPMLVALATAFIPVAVTALIQLLRKWGIEIEEKRAAALQNALEQAAYVALSRGTGQSAARSAVDYVKRSVPDAVKTFALDDTRIAEMLLPRITAAQLSAEPAAEQAVG